MPEEYKLKQIPEDFKVIEVSNVDVSGNSGHYYYYKLKKKDYSTIRAVERLSEALRINRRFIGYAGIKDKVAVTEQNISINGRKADHIVLQDINLEFLGRGSEPISLGDLKGNKFEITARNIDNLPVNKNRFPNYFGEQRFSSRNHLIGRAIVLKDFKGACNLVLEGDGDYERKVEAALQKSPNGFVNALSVYPPKLLTLFVHSFQSYIWNKAVKQLVDSGYEGENIALPLVGFDTRLKGDMGKIVKEILKEEGVKVRDFINRQIPYLTCEGDERLIFTDIEGLEISDLEEDDLNPGKKKCVLKFMLGKGSYATEAVKYLFNN